MKRFLTYALILTGSSVMLWGCPKKDVAKPNNSITAQINASAFSSNGNDVVVSIEANPSDNTKTELTITGSMDNTYLTIAIPDYNKNNGTGTYDFSTAEAIGGYFSGSGSDDVITSGSLVITSAGSTIAGTFSGTTQGGSAITSGSFSVEPGN